MTKNTMIKWKREIPTEPGIFLYNNPCSFQCIRRDIKEIDGILYIIIDGKMSKLSDWKGAAFMQWYGPIPGPPIIEGLK